MTKKHFLIPKLNGLKNDSFNPKTNFFIPNLFNKTSEQNISPKKTNFIIPSFGKPLALPQLGTSPNNTEFKSLSEVVANHLDIQINALNVELKNTTLEDVNSSDLVEKVDQITINQESTIDKISKNIDTDISLPYGFDASHLMRIHLKLLKPKTQFANVLCKKYKRAVFKLNVTKKMTPKRIKIFDFNVPSPDDGIKVHLKK